MSEALERNRAAWEERARKGDGYARPATDKELRDPMSVIDECGWLGGNIVGKRVLCLAAGGGRQSVLYAAAGAQVTVVDISAVMLELDRRVAAQHGLRVRTVEASMDNLAPLNGALFDFVIQPVSSCYVPEVTRVYGEVAKVTVPGGLYISQHKQPASLQAEALPQARGYRVVEPYYRQGALPGAGPAAWHREHGTVEFLHRWEELVGGLCRNGFVIEDLVEPRHAMAEAAPGSVGHRSYYLPPFVTICARRCADPTASQSKLWTPTAR